MKTKLSLIFGCVILALSFFVLSGCNENKWLVYSSKDLNVFEQNKNQYPAPAQKYLALRKTLEETYSQNREQDEYWNLYLEMLKLQYKYSIIFNLNSEELHLEYEKLKWYLINEGGKEHESRDISLFITEYSRLQNVIWNREVQQFLRPATKCDYKMWESIQIMDGKKPIHLNSDIDLDKIYVATQNFKTIARDITIIVPPHLKWLGGELEGVLPDKKVKLCYLDERDENREIAVFKDTEAEFVYTQN